MAKIDRKKLLKEPDEFLTISDRAVRWAKTHTRLLIVSVSSLLAAVLLVVGIQTYLNHRQAQGAQAFAQAFAYYADTVVGQAEPAQAAAAARELAQVVEKYGATEAGQQAALALGEVHLRQGRYAEAESVLRDLSDEPGLPAELAPLIWRDLGQALEGQKKYAEAAEAYQGAVKMAGPSLAGLFKLDQARALAAAGKANQAQEVYLALAGQEQDLTVNQLARQRLVALGVAPESLPSPAAAQ